MNDTMYKVIHQSKANWRTHERPMGQGDRYPIGEVESGFRIEALMAGSDIDREVLGEVLSQSGHCVFWSSWFWSFRTGVFPK